MDKQVYEKITQKKEFSQLPKKDVEKVYSLFDKPHLIEEEKIEKTRDLLRKVYFAFGSLKLLNPKIIDKKGVAEILKKHISTKERFEFYSELYEKLLGDFQGDIVDLGAGINGLSFDYLPKGVGYIGVEAVGQLVDLVKYYFKTRGIENALVIQMSLFELDKIKKVLLQLKGQKIGFLFKALDSLEMVERNYSKKLLREITPSVEKVVVSFATRSLISKKEFKVRRYWFENFIKEQGWKILDDFEMGGERYFVFQK